MPNFRKAIAVSTLLCVLSTAAHAGWVSTGLKPEPTPEPKSFAESFEECEVGLPASVKSYGPLDLTAETVFSVLQRVLTLI